MPVDYGSRNKVLPFSFAGNLGSLESLESIDVDYKSKKTSGYFKFSERSVSFSEFDLPELDPDDMPTLESILNDQDEDPFSVDDLGNSTNVKSVNISIASLGISNTRKERRPNVNGSVLRHVILKKISGQLMDACARRDAGLPTAMATSSLIAVGTSHGLVLVFEPRDQALKLILGTTAEGACYGAVTALGINLDCTRLLCGYVRGHITMWDLNTGNCLRVISDAHPPGYAVLHLQFTDDPTVAMLSDSSGSVYSLSFKRLFTRTCESNCFFSGSKGEVCAMEPLHLHSGMKDSPLYDTSLLAMATLTKLIIANLKPIPTAIFTKKLSGPPDTLPLLGWQFAVVQKEDRTKHLCPVIAFARGTRIHFYQVWKYGQEFKFPPFQTIETEYRIIAMHWMSPQVIVTIDSLEKIRTIDVGTQKELECLDLGMVQLVYGSSYFKSLATGGQVSKALKIASDYACYNSVQVFNGQLLLLGTKSIHCLTVRLWKDRIDYFVKQNLFKEALQLALSFYEGHAKAVVGLVGSRKRRKALVAEEIIEVLLAFLDVAMTVNCPKTNDEIILEKYFRSLVPICVRYCLAIDNLEILFGEVYDRFSDDVVSKRVFLEGLEPYILDDKIYSLSPVVMQDLVEHYEQIQDLKRLESCLVHLDVTAVDLHHMVKLCWTHALYDAVIYVYNKGLMDYVTPLEELLRIQNSIIKADKSVEQPGSAIGYKILVYISCCLAGNQYPFGEIDAKLVAHVKQEVFDCLTTKRSKFSAPGETTYPYLRALLSFDTREFLNVLSLAFEEKEFDLDEKSKSVGMLSRRQIVVDILLQIMVNDSTFSPSQVGCLFTFIARQMARYEDSIKVNKLLFEQVLEYLSNPDDDSRHEERQQALLELLNSGGLKSFDDERVLALAESAKFYQVCEILYQKKRQYSKILSCYWRDEARKHQCFSYIENVLTDESFTDIEKEEIQDAVVSAFDILVAIDSRKLARLFLLYFPSCLNLVVSKLDYEAEVQYVFLKGIFQRREKEKLIVRQKSGETFCPEPEIHERFIELMCRYDPEDVYLYLRGTDNYRLEQTLAIVQRLKVLDATAFLLEKTGDIQAAFQLLLNGLKEHLKSFSQAFAEHEDPMASTEVRGKRRSLKHAVSSVVQLCQRNSPRLESVDREALWFPLLETVMVPQRRIKDMTSPLFLTFKELTKQILASMMGHIALPAVLQKIMQDPAYNTGKFGEIKELMLGMLDTYNYELTLLETTRNLLNKDLHGQYCNQKRILSQGFSAHTSFCALCCQKLNIQRSSENDNDISLFRCGHSYHKKCLEGTVGLLEQLNCVLCDNKSSVMRSTTQKAGTDGTSESGNKESPGKRPLKKEKTKDAESQTLSVEQEMALNRLSKNNTETSKIAILADMNTSDSFQEWISGRSRAFTNSLPSSLVQSSSEHGVISDKHFSLKLVPPGQKRK